MSTKSTMKSTAKKHCKICFDAGLGEYTYSSHNVKERRGNSYVVVCKTLLNIRCNICLNKGHTTKYCRTEYKKTDYDKNTKPTVVVTAKKGKKQTPTNNTFASLMDDHGECVILKSSTATTENVSTHKSPVPVVKKRWSEMFDSDDEDN